MALALAADTFLAGALASAALAAGFLAAGFLAAAALAAVAVFFAAGFLAAVLRAAVAFLAGVEAVLLVSVFFFSGISLHHRLPRPARALPGLSAGARSRDASG